MNRNSLKFLRGRGSVQGCIYILPIKHRCILQAPADIYIFISTHVYMNTHVTYIVYSNMLKPISAVSLSHRYPVQAFLFPLSDQVIHLGIMTLHAPQSPRLIVGVSKIAQTQPLLVRSEIFSYHQDVWAKHLMRGHIRLLPKQCPYDRFIGNAS